LPARIEVLANDPQVIVDAAHTAESARTLADALKTLAPDGFELILSVSGDKNLGALLDALLPATRRVWVTQADRIRSMGVDVLAKNVLERAPTLAIEIVADPEEAARRARAALPPKMHLCSAGSVYLAGVVRRVLGPGRTSG
jgi:dihydrofolate synthase/folylpolyglutamate synthase